MVGGNNKSRAARRDTGRILRPGERAVSEVVSVVLLLGVVVVGVGIITVTIYSQPAPEKTPQVDILVSGNNNVISLTHNGGDPLAEGTFYVLADGERLENSTLQNGAWPWSIGEVLQYSVAPAPERVQVVYSGGGGAVLLKSATFSGAAGTAGPDVPAAGGGGELHYDFDTPEERDVWVIDQFVKMLESNSIYLSQSIKSDSDMWKSSGFFNFTITESDTVLNLSKNNPNNPETVPFTVGQKLSIKLENSKMRFFAIGQSGWHISAADVTIYRNDNKLDYDYIVEGKINGFTDFTSTVTITTASSEHNALYTDLYIYNVPKITGACSKKITLTHIQPAKPTLMILDISKNDPCYFVGYAESITGHN